MDRKNEKRVSIIVPVYNREKQIEACISSIQCQTYKNIEIICVDDGSHDNSVSIIKKMKADDARIVLIEKVNGGPSSARNAGLAVATGEYIQFVDSDDTIDEDMVEQLVNSLESNEAELVICGYRFSNELPARIPESGTWSKETFLHMFYKFYVGGFVNSPCNKMYVKKYITQTFPEDMNLGEDCVFNMMYISNVLRICVEEVAPYCVFIGDITSLSSRYNEKAFYCEEKKGKSILQCLEDVNAVEQQEMIKNEFRVDFKRCVEREILSRKYSKEELEERIYANLKNPFWEIVFGINEDAENYSEVVLKRKIKRHIRKTMMLKYRRSLFSMIKRVGKAK